MHNTDVQFIKALVNNMILLNNTCCRYNINKIMERDDTNVVPYVRSQSTKYYLHEKCQQCFSSIAKYVIFTKCTSIGEHIVFSATQQHYILFTKCPNTAMHNFSFPQLNMLTSLNMRVLLRPMLIFYSKVIFTKCTSIAEHVSMLQHDMLPSPNVSAMPSIMFNFWCNLFL